MSGQEFAALLRDHHTVLETAAADTGIIKSWFDRNRITRGERVWIANGERRLFVDIVTQPVARAVEEAHVDAFHQARLIKSLAFD